MRKVYILLYVFILVVCSGMVNAVTVADITDNLVFHLEMDTNCTLDSSAYVNEPSATSGTITYNAGNFVTNLDGYCNYDAGNTRLTYPFLPQYNNSNLNHTWALWFAYETGNGISVAIGTEIGGDYYQFLAPVREADSNKAWASIATGAAPDTVLSTSAYTTGKHYLVMTRNLTHMIIYVDGSDVNSVATTKDGLATIDLLCIGGRCGDIYGYKGNLTQVIFSNVTWTQADVDFMYNGGAGRSLFTGTGGGDNITVWLNNPTDNIVNNTEINLPFYYNVSSESADISNCSLYLNSSGTWGINESVFTGITNNSENNILANLTEGTYLWNIECCDTGDNCSFTSGGTVYENRTLTIDTTNPIITPEPDLGNNNIIVYNTTLDTYINFSDNHEIYSINITYGNGTTYYNGSNLGVTSQQVNITDIINQVGLVNLTARVCDSHTLTSISNVDWSNKDNGLEFVMEKKFLFLKDEWVHIYPKSYSEYTLPTTYKEKDRYPFIFNKKDAPSEGEIFVVESSDYIDIIGNKNYQGHLVIPNIGENGYWVDFENGESTKTEIKRIGNTKIEVTIYGLKSKRIEFNSIGELNCVSETFYFNNINPSIGYTSNVIVGDTSTFYLNITEDSVIVTNLNATLWYNHTAYYVSAISNFTKSVIVPTSVDGNTSLIPFFWSINVDGTEYNLTSYNQNVSDFYLDDCSAHSIEALNFTIIDEETSALVNADWDGRFNYSYNGIKKYYDLTITADNTTQMCIFPNNISFTNSDYYIYYDESGYPQRKYIDTPVTIDNVTDNIVMYALASADGIYGRFQIVDSYSNPIEDASGIMKKEISGSWTTIESETSDGSGLMTFWLNPDTTYQFTFSKAGYGSVTETLRVTTTEIYTVTLGGTAEPRNISYSAGVSYGFYPNFDLQNNTKYNFSFVMDSDYWDITDCTLYLKNGSTTISSSSTSYTSRNCNITIELDTNSYTTITSEAIYNLNSSSDITDSTQYTVAYRYVGEFSLKSFLDDLKAFGGAGFNDFTRMVIAFIIIFILLASVSYNMGVVDPEVTIGLLIMLTCLFSYIGWLTLPYDGIRTEWLKQYIIAILISLGGGAFIMKRATE